MACFNNLYSSSSKEKCRTHNQSINKTQKDLFNIDEDTNVPIEFKSIKKIIPLSDKLKYPYQIEFDTYCDKKTNFKIKSVKKCTNSDKTTISVEFEHAKGGDAPTATLKWSYHSSTKTLKMDAAYRGDLPVWMKFGNPNCWLSQTKGVPTMKLLKLILIKELGLNKYNVKKFEAIVQNPQTIVDIIHSKYIKQTTLAKACAESATSKLIQEAADCIGIENKIYLTHIKTGEGSVDSSYDLPSLIQETEWSEEQKSTFTNSDKFKKLSDCGINLWHYPSCESDCDEIPVPTPILTYQPCTRTESVTKKISIHKSFDIDFKSKKTSSTPQKIAASSSSERSLSPNPNKKHYLTNKRKRNLSELRSTDSKLKKKPSKSNPSKDKECYLSNGPKNKKARFNSMTIKPLKSK